MLDTTLELAEAMAMRYGLEIARTFGYGRVLMEGETINIIKQ